MQGNPLENRPILLRVLSYWTEERSLSMVLLLLTVHLFVLTPGSFLGRAIHVSGTLLLSLALLAGFLTLVQQRALRWAAVLVVVCGALSRAAALFVEGSWPVIADTLFTLLSLSALLYIVFLQINREGPVTAHRIRGAVALYLLIAMFFAFLYRLAEEVSPGAFNMPASLAGAPGAYAPSFYYFSVVTLTTVGFGDISPVHPFVRSLVMFEALIGQLYPAILIARLVTLELETRRSGK